MTAAGAYAFCHIAFTIANAPSGNLLLDSRQFIPAYVPLVVVIVMALDLLLSKRDQLALPRWPANTPALSYLDQCVKHTTGGVIAWFMLSAFALCVIYAGFVSIRDTHKAVFEPEVGWNAYVYNGDHIDIQTTSLTEYLKSLVGDAQPIVRDHFDIYLADGSLIYFKDVCDDEDMEAWSGIRLRVEPVNKLVLSGIRKNFGIDIFDFIPIRQGAILDGKCLMLAPLPKYRIANISTGQYRNDIVELWEVSFVPHP